MCQTNNTPHVPSTTPIQASPQSTPDSPPHPTPLTPTVRIVFPSQSEFASDDEDWNDSSDENENSDNQEQRPMIYQQFDT